MNKQELYNKILALIEYQMIIGEYQDLEGYMYSELEMYENTYTEAEVSAKQNQIKKYRETIENSKHRRNELLGEIWFMVDYLSYPVWFDMLCEIRSTMRMARTTGAVKAMQGDSSQDPEDCIYLMAQILADDEKQLEQCKSELFSCIEEASHEI